MEFGLRNVSNGLIRPLWRSLGFKKIIEEIDEELEGE